MHPAISVEGYEEETDMRRGKGTFKAVMKAMEILKRKRLLFGMSTCYHRKNVDVVGSSEYLDFMIDQGAAFVWYFTYMPVGNDAVPELMVTSDSGNSCTSKYVCSVRQSRSLLWFLE